MSCLLFYQSAILLFTLLWKMRNRPLDQVQLQSGAREAMLNLAGRHLSFTIVMHLPSSMLTGRLFGIIEKWCYDLVSAKILSPINYRNFPTEVHRNT